MPASRSRISRVVLAAMALGATACRRELVSIPAAPEQVVIHGVLNPADTMQIVLIERTLTGAVATPIVLPFDAGEPIYSDWGVAERAATTEIVGPDGTVFPGSEYSDCFQVPERLCRGNGAGMYKFFLHGSDLVPGGRYTFHAVTTRGELVSAETIVPEASLAAEASSGTFNRSTDTLALSWSDSRAPAYQVRVENPDGAWSSFTDSTRVALTGALRNPDQARLPRVFIPGLRQLVTVTAVDANMYDYYRTMNNSFVGYGAVSRVSGAYGVFGSAVTVVRRNVTVTANQTLPIEGLWDAVDSGLGYIYFANHLNIYVESPATRSSEADAISGNYYNSDPAFAAPMTGTFQDGRLVLAMGSGLNQETLGVELRGDTLVGSYSKGAPARFVKRK